MDEQLAQIYGTNQSYDAEDLEKTAAAELLVKIAEEQGVDLDQFSDEEIGEMLQELYGTEKTAEAPAEPELDESQQKVAEADYLGRVMAHAMVQEANLIEKEAAKGSALKRGVEAAKGAAESAKNWVKGRPGHYRKAGGELKKAWEGVKEPAKGRKKEVKETLMERLKHVGKAAKHVAPEAGAAAGVGGAAYGVHKLREKKSADEQFEQAALARAAELAAEAGWVDQDGDLVVPEQEKTAEPTQFDLDTRALQILQESGYPVEWNQ